MITKEDLIDIGFKKQNDRYGDLWLDIDREISIQFIEHRLVFWCSNHTRDLHFSTPDDLRQFVGYWLNGIEFQKDATHAINEEDEANGCFLKAILIIAIIILVISLIYYGIKAYY